MGEITNNAHIDTNDAAACKSADIQRIPKKLHYVWLGGGKFSELMTTCMASWSKLCPDYEIIEWNETNFDMNNPWVRLAVEERNWALASDVMRAYILYEHGGIYIDTDVEILQPLDRFLEHDFWMGYECRNWVNTAIIGSAKGNEIVRLAMERYERTEAVRIDPHTNLHAVQVYSTLFESLYGIKPNGKMTLHESGLALYPSEYFYPQHYLTHKIRITPDSYAIHRCSCSWHSKGQGKMFRRLRVIRRVIGAPIFGFFEGKVAKGYRKKIRKEFDNASIKISPVPNK